MSATPLTQQEIDEGSSASRSLLQKAADHPILAGGIVIVGAGLAYAAVRMIMNGSGEVAREVHI